MPTENVKNRGFPMLSGAIESKDWSGIHLKRLSQLKFSPVSQKGMWNIWESRDIGVRLL